MKTILLVDDNLNYLQLLSLFLESKGFDVTIASSAADALAMVKMKSFDMIITDLNMPGMDGFGLAMKVKGDDPEARIMMLTGDSSPDIVETAGNIGISEILPKPVNTRKLLEVIYSSFQEKSDNLTR